MAGNLSLCGESPLGAIGRGLLAGAVGTAAMTAWQELSAKLMSDGEEESSGGSEEPKDPWEEASTPAKAAKKIGEGLFDKEIPAEKIEFTTNATHWSYGSVWGGIYGLFAGTAGNSTLGGGLAFGSAVWGMSYVQLVPMGLYEPPWKYPPKQLALDLSYHLAYGGALGLAYKLLSPR